MVFMGKKYEIHEEEPQMVSETMPLTLSQIQSEQVEALWTLIKNQGTLVQEALYERLCSFFKRESIEAETAQHIFVRESLHRAFDNMRKADMCSEREQTLDEFLNEL